MKNSLVNEYVNNGPEPSLYVEGGIKRKRFHYMNRNFI